jgi:DNA gyrase subunit A
MEDLDRDTVDFVPNYDETKREPTVFPAKFPNLLCNGSTGIAVGMATNIPPHNLSELLKATVLVLDDPSTSIDEIMGVMPGPDFPTGGLICGYRGIKEAFHTGKGKLILRGVATIEDMPGQTDRQRIVITEVPYGVNKAHLVEQVAEHIQEKIITGISDLRDESDRDGLRVVVELKRNEVPEVVLNQLYKFSDLQTTFGCQMLALDKGLPRLVNIKQMISAWIEHRVDVIRRRTRFELAQAEARAHILAGYLKAIDMLDAVVALIRQSGSKEEAKTALISNFAFSDRQATAILDLRLYQLTALEHGKISNEYTALLEKIIDYKAILESESRVKGIIRDELSELLKHHSQGRKTQIVHAESEVDVEDLIANEEVIITISNDDYIKRMHIDTFKEQRRGGHGVVGIELKKENDAIKGVFVASTHDYLLIFTNLGRCYWLKCWQIPDAGRRSKGRPLVNLLEDLLPNEKISTVIKVEDFAAPGAILMATKQGVVKKTDLTEFSNPRRKGIIALSIDEGDELIAVRKVVQGQEVMLFTRQGMAVRFNESEVRSMGRTARGVRGVTLRKDGDAVVGCETVSDEEILLIVCENGFGKRSKVDDFRKAHRGGVGVRSIITSDRNGTVVAGLCVTDDDNLLLTASSGQTIRISLKDVRIMSRNTQGVRLVNLKDAVVVAVQRLAAGVSSEESPVVPLVVEGTENAVSQLDVVEETSVEDEGS